MGEFYYDGAKTFWRYLEEDVSVELSRYPQVTIYTHDELGNPLTMQCELLDNSFYAEWGNPAANDCDGDNAELDNFLNGFKIIGGRNEVCS